MKSCNPRLLIAIIGALLILTGCGGRTDEIRNAVQPTAITAHKPTAAPRASDDSTDPTVPPEPTSAPEPTVAPVAEKKPLELGKFGFGQDKRYLGFGFMVSNPNETLAVSNTQYQVAVYDEAGTVIETDSGYIELLLPSQQLGVAGNIILGEGASADKITVQLNDGTYESSEPLPTFTTDKIAYQPDENFPRTVGMIKSPYKKDVANIRVSAIGYDDAGNITGGGFTYLNFIPANSEVAVSMSMAGSVPKKVELYPSLSGLSIFGGSETTGASEPIAIEKQGFGQGDFGTSYGFVVKNPAADTSIENSAFRAEVYAEDGSILGVEEGYIEVLLPSQSLGIGGDISIVGEGKVAKLIVHVLNGKAQKTTDKLPPFTAENIAYKSDDMFPKVTGIVKSPYSKDVKQVKAFAIVYDGTGSIIGGGFTYIDFVPANGQAAADISVKTNGKVDQTKTEVYATLSGLSEFESKP
jgi:hypothetical protein